MGRYGRLGFVGAGVTHDKHYFPPYEAVPLLREDSLKAHPGSQWWRWGGWLGKVSAGGSAGDERCCGWPADPGCGGGGAGVSEAGRVVSLKEQFGVLMR